jgi:transposase
MVGHKNRIEKFLQQCGIKLSTFLSDIFGISGMLLIRKLCKQGQVSTTEVQSCLKGTLRNKLSEVRQAVNGRLSEHERVFLSTLVDTFERCQKEIENLEEQIMVCAAKYKRTLVLLETIPALQDRAATIIISELGIDLSMFPTAGHLCKWAGLCPGDFESAGKKKSTRITKGNPHIKSVLVQCAWSATRCKNFFLRDWFYRLRARRGTKKALIAVARKLLSIIWHMITNNEPYSEERYDLTKKAQEEKRIQQLKAEAAKRGLKLVPA